MAMLLSGSSRVARKGGILRPQTAECRVLLTQGTSRCCGFSHHKGSCLAYLLHQCRSVYVHCGTVTTRYQDTNLQHLQFIITGKLCTRLRQGTVGSYQTGRS